MLPRYFRLAHAKFRPLVNVGDKVRFGKINPLTGEENKPLGIVGSSGVSTGPHVHLDGTLGAPKSWHQYKNRPFAEYFNTAPWASRVLPYPNQKLRSLHSISHRGVDVNVEPEDLGLPFYSPCNGTIVYVEPAVSFYRLMRGIRVLFQPTYGQGFGNFCWVREDISSYEPELRSILHNHPNIESIVLGDLPIALTALDELGFTITDLLNTYTNFRRTGKHVFDLSKPKP